MKKIMTGLLCLLFALTSLLLAAPLPVAAAEEGTAHCSLTIGGNAITSSAKIAVPVTIRLDDEELQKHSLYLSFHYYTPEGELLYYEGDRIALSGWTDGEIRDLPVIIDLSLVEPVARVKHLVISFDIADMTGNSWFSENPGVELSSETVEYNGSQLMKLKESAQMAVRRPIALLVNTVVFLAAVFFAVKFKKAGIFT